MIFILCLLGLAAAGVATELLTNGEFELPLDSGWTVVVEPPSSDYTILTGTRYRHDPDKELFVYKSDESVARVEQAVSVSRTDLFFGCYARFATREYDTLSPHWAAAGVMLSYLDSTGAVLGRTLMANLSPQCPLASDSSFHVIAADGNWNTWLMDVSAELESLPAVNPPDIRSISVAIVDTTDGNAQGQCEAWTWIDDVSLFDTLAPDLRAATVVVDDGHNGVLDPGEVADVYIRLRNAGPSLAGVTGTLTADNPRVTVLDNGAAWGAIAAGDTAYCLGDRFRLEASPTPPAMGDSVRLQVELWSGLAVVETLHLALPIGDSVSLPTGPYYSDCYAFDDGESDQAAQFNWIEVNGIGAQLALGDDQTATVDLPPQFVFRSYGHEFTRFSICSNGWIAPGVTSNNAYGNTPLPNPGMPGGLIAANWDDLYPEVGNGIWWYCDTLRDWLVVEWDSVSYYGNPTLPDKFEIVIFGQSWPSPSVNSTVLCQYLTAFNYYSSTLGVQDWDRATGITYCCDDEYARTAAPVMPGRAIRYDQAVTTPVEDEAGTGIVPRRLELGSTLFRGRLSVSATGNWQGPVRVSVVDNAGRLVRWLTGDALGRSCWDGRDAAGRACGAGVYFIVAADRQQALRAKAVKLD